MRYPTITAFLALPFFGFSAHSAPAHELNYEHQHLDFAQTAPSIIPSDDDKEKPTEQKTDSDDKKPRPIEKDFDLSDLEDSDYLGLFFKFGFAVMIPFDEKGAYRGGAGNANRVTNSFSLGYAPTFAIGYDFNKDFSSELNVLFYKTDSMMHLVGIDRRENIATNNTIISFDQSYNGLAVWQMAFPLRFGVGALLWNQEPFTASDNSAQLERSGFNFFLKFGTGLKFNIVEELSVFSTMDIETRFDYYMVFGDRRNINSGGASELLLTRQSLSGGIGSFMIDFKMGF